MWRIKKRISRGAGKENCHTKAAPQNNTLIFNEQFEWQEGLECM